MRGIVSNNNHFTGKKKGKDRPHKKKFKKKNVHVNKYGKEK